MRSRVMPGSLVTMDRRVPVRRLKSVDLPTFGRPTITRDAGVLVMDARSGRWHETAATLQSSTLSHLPQSRQFIIGERGHGGCAIRDSQMGKTRLTARQCRANGANETGKAQQGHGSTASFIRGCEHLRHVRDNFFGSALLRRGTAD